MTAQLLDGKALAADIRASLAQRVAALAARSPAATGGTASSAATGGTASSAAAAPGEPVLGSARSWSATIPAAAPT